MSQDLLATETNRRQLQQIISGLSDGVILLEADRRIVWANEAALAMHGSKTSVSWAPMTASTPSVSPCVIVTITPGAGELPHQ